MFLLIYLGEIVAFKLVDQKQVSVLDIIETIVNEKLFPAGDGVIDLIAIMDVHIHCFSSLYKCANANEWFSMQLFMDSLQDDDAFMRRRPPLNLFFRTISAITDT